MSHALWSVPGMANLVPCLPHRRPSKVGQGRLRTRESWRRPPPGLPARVGAIAAIRRLKSRSWNSTATSTVDDCWWTPPRSTRSPTSSLPQHPHRLRFYEILFLTAGHGFLDLDGARHRGASVPAVLHGTGRNSPVAIGQAAAGIRRIVRRRLHPRVLQRCALSGRAPVLRKRRRLRVSRYRRRRIRAPDHDRRCNARRAWRAARRQRPHTARPALPAAGRNRPPSAAGAQRAMRGPRRASRQIRFACGPAFSEPAAGAPNMRKFFT